jgi:6-phosphogluconolactonase
MKNLEIFSFATAEELAWAAAKAWTDEIGGSVGTGRSFSVALSGGRITQKLFASVVKRAQERKTSLEHVHFFWADERCVPPTDPESNFQMAQKLLFAPLNISGHHIHRIRGEDAPAAAAQTAQEEMIQIVPLNPAGQPEIDLIFLGLGEDGHVASLFPGEPEEVSNDPRVYRAVLNSPKPPSQRVTLGYPAIAGARQVWMLASGSGKEIAFRESLLPGGRTPFARVLRMRSHTKILTDFAVSD